jgi:hypothetical protein
MLLSLLACGQSTPTEEPPTWNEDVAPIVAEHCGSCHVSGGIAPFPLESYADASSMASSMVAAVEAGTMPPWGAETTDECEPRYGFMDDPRLSDEEKATLAAWADGGAPEGSGPLAELPASPDLSLADPDQVLAPDTAYVTSGDSDEFRCFVLDPGLNEDAWLTGLQVEAGNEAVVHHVLAFADPDRASEKLVGSDGTYDCFGGPGFNDTALLGAWAPGAFPFQAPDTTGIPVAAGSLIVMQIHYHPAGEVADPDVTSLEVRWADAPPARDAVLALLGNASSRGEGLVRGPDDSTMQPEFVIPANVAGHTETIELDVEEGDGPYDVFAAGTHMHYIGTDMLVEVDHAFPTADEPATECMVQTPHWDFNWQRAYRYDAPLDSLPQVREGDTIRLRCTYDNTMDNPGTRAALADAGLDAPIDVYLGESTLDEMCLGVFGVVLPPAE